MVQLNTALTYTLQGYRDGTLLTYFSLFNTFCITIYIYTGGTRHLCMCFVKRHCPKTIVTIQIQVKPHFCPKTLSRTILTIQILLKPQLPVQCHIILPHGIASPHDPFGLRCKATINLTIKSVRLFAIFNWFNIYCLIPAVGLSVY